MKHTLRLPASIQTIPEGLAFWAGQTPHVPALRALDGRQLTHGELCDAVAEVATRLQAHGVRPEDRVALVLPSGFTLAIVLLGTMAVAEAAPLSVMATARELARDIERLPARLIISDESYDPAGREAATSLRIPSLSFDEHVPCPTGPRACGLQPWAVGPNHIAAILHTSGTTGLPKRVPRPHRTFVAGAHVAGDSSGLTPDDVGLVASGLHTNSGMVNLSTALLTGGTCLIAPGIDPTAFPALLEEHQPTWMVSTASELNLILAASSAAGRARVAGPRSRLRVVRTGAQPMTPGTAERAEQSLGALMLESFGMTEASYITSSGPTSAERRAGSCGRAAGCVVRIVNGDREPVPPGVAGEIVIRGATLFPGYLDDPEANASAFLPDGWFRTGDLGYIDADGYLFITGRQNELINRGGEKIAPLEIDRALLTHPAVREAAAFSVPDARLGEDVVAAVVLEPEAKPSVRELRMWMLERLSPYKTPRRIWVVDRLPRTGTGKVQRGELARRWCLDHECTPP
jgi:acyl-CoA synthetase (AMP-forming)/AMP-acid ligase II